MRPYMRKISAEEAKEGYLLLTKDRLSDFPPVGDAFTMLGDEAEGEAKVESYRCTCRGPKRPHDHWYIRPPAQLRRGDEATITQTSEDPPAYALRVKRPWAG